MRQVAANRRGPGAETGSIVPFLLGRFGNPAYSLCVQLLLRS
jgi:hypothetical protein